ncbi:MAG: helix-turn-helix domain-containing protein [Oscillospiraceae bacterium]|nr:helix-turn-helix domain-containing protein [Oscillospiraceae bacterium]
MRFSEKLEVLIRRNGLKKTEFAEQIGITYRALANYISGSREPKQAVLLRIAEALDTDMVFLTDDARSLVLTSEERFYFGATSEGRGVLDARYYLDKSREIFGGDKLSEDDKQSLFSCVTEIYFAAKNKHKGGTL